MDHLEEHKQGVQKEMTEFVVVVEWKVHVLQSMNAEHYLVEIGLNFRTRHHNCSPESSVHT